jgi:hypothetical protein
VFFLTTTRHTCSRTVDGVPSGTDVHPEFGRALEVLAAVKVSYADAWRMLIPTALRLGLPRPGYGAVRRILIEERALTAESEAAGRPPQLEPILLDLLTGRIDLLVERLRDAYR